MLHVTKSVSMGTLGGLLFLQVHTSSTKPVQAQEMSYICHSLIPAWVRAWHIPTSVSSLRDAATINMTVPGTAGDLWIAESFAQQNTCTHR